MYKKREGYIYIYIYIERERESQILIENKIAFKNFSSLL